MGGPASPSVFHTTPPQPALKARTTLYSLSVGGAEASQNGLGDLMPTNSVRRSAMAASCIAACCVERRLLAPPPPRPSPIKGEGAEGNSRPPLQKSPPPLWGRVRVGGATNADLDHPSCRRPLPG